MQDNQTTSPPLLQPTKLKRRSSLSSDVAFRRLSQVLNRLPVCDQEKLIKASWLVEDAFLGLSRPHPPPTLHAARLYKVYHMFQRPRRLGVVVLLLVSYLETPFWCHGSWPTPCGVPGDPTTPLTSGMLCLTLRNAYVIELVCLMMSLLNDAVLYAGFQRAYFALYDRVFLTGCVVVALINATVHYFVGGSTLCAQVAPFLRLAIFMATYRDIRKTYTKMYKVLAEVQNILALVAIYICFFASLSTILFQGTDEGMLKVSRVAEYLVDMLTSGVANVMPNFVDDVWQLLILLTSANFPDIMMPAYATNRASSLFFIVFVTFGIFFLVNLVLAQIFSNFQTITISEAATADTARRALLREAFDVLESVQHTIEKQFLVASSDGGIAAVCDATEDVRVINVDAPVVTGMPPSAPGKPTIEIELTVLLFQELSFLNVTSSTMTRDDMLELFHKLESSNASGTINVDNFLVICDVMGHFESTYRPPPSEIERWWPSVARQKWYKRVCALVRHKRFEGLVDTILAINGVLVVAEMARGSVYNENPSWAFVNTAFSVIYALEMLFKMTVYGIRDYVHYFRNQFDGIVTIICLAIDIYVYCPNPFQDRTIVKLLLVVRCLRLLRILLAVDRFRVVLATGWAMLPIGKNLLLAMVCTMNLFAIVGHQLFGGKISPSVLTSDPRFVNSTYAAAGYAANNFNDIASGMVTLFELLVVNNWYVIVDGHVRATSTLARLFFVAFWLVGVYLTLSLIVASILDAFSREYNAAVEVLAKQSRETESTVVPQPQHATSC
ncbi:Aste57867_5959 [Aphanomyces stellatus]|uniref:Aste57867_5959 protein n=1 Tax=Aphanomyces stellatus TaxID=120398 RepID=A0A485KHN7_9STRA|nr:hypothetical protein As57867_005945 [Aphanomyces stellatus]VFT82976.1 Aste57867_5959 [Aphanomyces stellatus]